MADAATVNNSAEQITSVVHMDHVVLLVIGGVILMVAIFALLSVLISLLNYEDNPVRDRLLLLKDKAAYEEAKRKKGAFEDLKEALLTFSGPLSQKLYGENQGYRQQVKQLLTAAGLPDSEEHVWQFLARRVAVGIVVGGLGFVGTFISTFGMITFCLVGLIGGFMLGSLIPQFMLRAKAGKRQTEIRYTLPDTLDLLVVCMEAGLALDATIQRVSEETEYMAPEISYEMKRLNKELNAGIARMDAFQNMGERAGVEELKSLCAMIIQSDKMGTSVSDTLRIYADDLRVKRRQKAEELAAKASIKMTFPLVLFIFPPMFIVLMGPMVIQTVQQFFPAMNG